MTINRGKLFILIPCMMILFLSPLFLWIYNDKNNIKVNNIKNVNNDNGMHREEKWLNMPIKKVPSKYPSTLQKDRMNIVEAYYGKRSVTKLLQQLYDTRGYRRLRITNQYALDYLFGQPSGDKLEISYSYRGKNEFTSTPVKNNNSYNYLENDLVIPSNLVEDDILQYNLGVEPYKKYLEGKRGIELGGPSPLFRSPFIPLYELIGSLDNINFANNTLWEDSLQDGGAYAFSENKPIGVQYILDITDLSSIYTKQYEVVASCHTLEHIVNPLKAVEQMVHLLSPGGILLLILPNKNTTFDHYRDYTTMDHLLKHYEEDTPESSLEHVEEVFLLSDLSLDAPAGNIFQFLGRSSQNGINRAIHQHVFHYELLKQICDWTGLSVIHQDCEGTNVLTICRKNSIFDIVE